MFNIVYAFKDNQVDFKATYDTAQSIREGYSILVDEEGEPLRFKTEERAEDWAERYNRVNTYFIRDEMVIKTIADMIIVADHASDWAWGFSKMGAAVYFAKLYSGWDDWCDMWLRNECGDQLALFSLYNIISDIEQSEGS